MKRTTAVWKMKQSMSKWGVSIEYWQDVKDILREFEMELKAKYHIGD